MTSYMRSEIEQFIPVKHAANDLGVPQTWLIREAREGRIPVLRAGVRLLCDVDEVRAALLNRTREQATGT